MKRLLPLIAFALSLCVQAQTLPTTKPSIIGVFLQPKRNLPAWHNRGVNVAIGRDREANADGSDGVTLPQWQAAAVAAGVDYIVEPSGNLAADAKDPHRRGWLYPIDELDNAIISAQDNRATAAQIEAMYVALETFTKNCHAASSTMPVWLNVDANNFQYRKVNYARIFAACDKISCDYYPVQRGSPITNYSTLLDSFKAVSGGNKLALAYVEVSFQHLDPTYFHGGRGPMVAEWVQEVNLCTSRNLSVAWFPQCIGGDGKAGFNTDATDPAIAAAMTSWLVSATTVTPPATQPTTAPADPILSVTVLHASGKMDVSRP